MLPWQPSFDGHFFLSENEKSLFKMKKITFLTINFVFLGEISVSLTVLIILFA